MDHNNYKAVSRGLKLTLLLLTISVFLPVAAIFAQKVRNDIPPLRERLFYGGSFGLQFGTITDIQVSPVVGIWLLPRLAAAVGPDYRFYKDPNYRTDIYGGSGYMQFVFIQDLDKLIPLGVHMGFFIHAEDELLSLQSSFWKNPPYPTDRFFINTVLAGAGISQQMGRRSSMNFMFLWALNKPVYDIYSNPEIRLSFIF
jgi:hypothetical protein